MIEVEHLGMDVTDEEFLARCRHDDARVFLSRGVNPELFPARLVFYGVQKRGKGWIRFLGANPCF